MTERRHSDKFHQDISRELGGIHEQMKGLVEQMTNLVEEKKIANGRTAKLESKVLNLETWQQNIDPITEGLGIIQAIKKFSTWLGVSFLALVLFTSWLIMKIFGKL